MTRTRNVLAAADATLDAIRRAQQEAESAAAVAWLDEQWAEYERAWSSVPLWERNVVRRRFFGSVACARPAVQLVGEYYGPEPGGKAARWPVPFASDDLDSPNLWAVSVA